MSYISDKFSEFKNWLGSPGEEMPKRSVKSSTRRFAPRAEEEGLLSSKKAKFAAIAGLLLTIGLILHFSGALDGLEKALNEKVFTPMGDFFSENQDTIVKKVLPGIAGGVAAIGLGVLGYKKGKEYFNKKLEEKTEERVAQSLSTGEARNEIDSRVRAVEARVEKEKKEFNHQIQDQAKRAVETGIERGVHTVLREKEEKAKKEHDEKVARDWEQAKDITYAIYDEHDPWITGKEDDRVALYKDASGKYQIADSQQIRAKERESYMNLYQQHPMAFAMMAHDRTNRFGPPVQTDGLEQVNGELVSKPTPQWLEKDRKADEAFGKTVEKLRKTEEELLAKETERPREIIFARQEEDLTSSWDSEDSENDTTTEFVRIKSNIKEQHRYESFESKIKNRQN